MKKLLILVLFSASVQAEPSILTCFTPQLNCTGAIVAAIHSAKKDIRMQGYSFTSLPIAQALVEAKNRGVEVDVILDRTNFTSEVHLCEKLLAENGIPLWNDYKPDIAHNKIIILDSEYVITGSFNFTNAAQYKNAENVIIVDDTKTASAYLANWQYRMNLSKKV